MKPVRRLMTRLTNKLSSDEPQQQQPSKNRNLQGKYAQKLHSSENNATTNEAINAQLAADPVSEADLQEALQSTKPSSKGSIMNKYIAWQTEFGSV